jgi:hypothetical protein
VGAQTNKQNSMKQMNKKEFKEFADKLFPVMSPKQQKQVLHQLIKQANEDSRKQAILDPLSRIPRA